VVPVSGIGSLPRDSFRRKELRDLPDGDAGDSRDTLVHPNSGPLSQRLVVGEDIERLVF
jgi:hypothetical protein